MRKNKKSLIAGIILLFCTVFMSVVMLACAPSGLKFEKGTLQKSEDYNYAFEVYAHKQGWVEISFEDKVYSANTEERIKSVVDKIVSDYQVLKNTFELENTVKVVVAMQAETGDFFCGDTVYCEIAGIDSTDFRAYLAGAYLRADQPWKAYGASAYAFGVPYPDVEWDYYNNPENMMTLSLFAGYFVDEMADEDTLAAAKRTAHEYSSYLIDTHGKDYFLSADSTAHSLTDRQAWLQSIGASGTYTMPYDLSWLSGARYTAARNYPLVIKTEKRTYNISPMHKGFYGTMITDAFGTPDEVLRELSENITEVERMLAHIQTNAPTAYPYIMENYNKHIMYNVYSHTGTTLDGQIELLEIGEFVIQTMRKIIMDDLGGVNRWTIEGAAEYFECAVSRRLNGKIRRGFQDYVFDFSSSSEYKDYEPIAQKVRDYYSAKKPIGTLAEYDTALGLETFAALTLLNPEIKDYTGFHPYVYKEITGSYLTRPQAYLFTHYITHEFGLDKVLMFCLNKGESNFEAQFGKTYDTVFSQFMAELRAGQLNLN